jgi:TrmH family RNA methyltransferase
VTSRQNKLVARYRAAARGEADGLLLLDGAHLVAEAVEAGLDIRSAIVAADAGHRPGVAALLERLSDRGVQVATASRGVIEAVSPVRSPSPIVALAERPQSGARVWAGAAPLVLVAVGVQDPGNLGAIVRVAEAAGASGLVAAGGSADPFGWKALRGSMGSALRLPLLVATPERALAEAKQHGCRIVAAVPREGRSLFEVDLTAAAAVFVGAEGSGLETGLLEAADERVTIPMQAPVESLNAAVAAAVLAYEALRQRQIARP